LLLLEVPEVLLETEVLVESVEQTLLEVLVEQVEQVEQVELHLQVVL
jgi:hypothetical protein